MFNFHFSLSLCCHIIIWDHTCWHTTASQLIREQEHWADQLEVSVEQLFPLPHIPHAPLRCFLYQPQWQPYQHQTPIKISSSSCYRPPPRQQQILILLCIGSLWTRPIWRYLPLFLVSSDDYLVGGTSWPTYVSTYIYVLWHMSPY